MTLPVPSPESRVPAFPWFPGEVEVWRAKEALPTSRWAEKHRTVTIGSHQGQWDNAVTPYLAQIMDTADLPWVEELVICGPPQSGKTNACINIMLNNIYRYGGNGKFVMFPTEALAKLFYQIRLIPILGKTPPLASRLFQGDKVFTNSEKVTLRDGTVIFPTWGSSASKLSSFPGDFVWADEVDKNDSLTGVETDPLSLLEDRVRTARRRKILKCSSPTVDSGPIWRALQKCMVRYTRHVVCPHCGELQEMTHEQITWPGQMGLFTGTRDRGPGTGKGEIPQPDLDPEFLKSGKLARYVCPSCGGLWDDLDRNKAVAAGQWVPVSDVTGPRSPVPGPRPRSIGFHISGLICPDISLSDIAAEIVRARSNDPADIRRLYNSYLGLPSPTQDLTVRVGLEALEQRAETYGPLLPDKVALLTAGADVQADRIEVEIVGWSVGRESWGIEYAVLYGDTRLPEVWDQLDRHLLRTWQHEAGPTLGIARVFVDAGYLPQMVYRFTGPRRARGIYAIEGAENVKAPEVAGPSNRHRAGITVPVYALGVNRLKSTLFGDLALETTGPGYCHIPGTRDSGFGTGKGHPQSPVPSPGFWYPENWYDMIRAEHAVPADPKRPDLVRWEKRKGGLRNEAIDCRVYALAALMSMRVDLKGMLENLRGTAPARQRTVYSEGVKRG